MAEPRKGGYYRMKGAIGKVIELDHDRVSVWGLSPSGDFSTWSDQAVRRFSLCDWDEEASLKEIARVKEMAGEAFARKVQAF